MKKIWNVISIVISGLGLVASVFANKETEANIIEEAAQKAAEILSNK